MRLDQVEHRSGEPDQRESPDAAGDRWFVALVDFLEGEAEKKREDEQQGQPFGEFDRRHRSLYTPADLAEFRRLLRSAYNEVRPSRTPLPILRGC